MHNALITHMKFISSNRLSRKNASLRGKRKPHYDNDRVVPQDLITCTFRRKHFRFFVTATCGDFPTVPKQLHSAFRIPFCVLQICEVAGRDLWNLDIFQFNWKNVLLFLIPWPRVENGDEWRVKMNWGEESHLTYCSDVVNTSGNFFKEVMSLAILTRRKINR